MPRLRSLGKNFLDLLLSLGPRFRPLGCLCAQGRRIGALGHFDGTAFWGAPHRGHTGLLSYTQITFPRFSQKCDLQPLVNHTEGVKLGRPLVSRSMSHRGLASWITNSSMVRPQPHGHFIPTDQSSPSSRAKTRSRKGILVGKESPSTIISRRDGPKRSSHLRSHWTTGRKSFIYDP